MKVKLVESINNRLDVTQNNLVSKFVFGILNDSTCFCGELIPADKKSLLSNYLSDNLSWFSDFDVYTRQTDSYFRVYNISKYLSRRDSTYRYLLWHSKKSSSSLTDRNYIRGTNVLIPCESYVVHIKCTLCQEPSYNGCMRREVFSSTVNLNGSWPLGLYRYELACNIYKVFSCVWNFYIVLYCI